jgi:hypothetical protein
MSTVKDKKTALLAKLAKQKAKQKDQIFTIPLIKLTAKGKQQMAQKTSIPNTKTLDVRIKNDDKMRNFMTELSGLGDSDFDILPTSNTIISNTIISNGYKLFTYSFKKDSIDDQTTDQQQSSGGETAWIDTPVFQKKIWVLKSYGLEKNAEWGRKIFTENVEQIALSDDILNDIIGTYLNGSIPYYQFIANWKLQRGSDKVTKKDIEKQLIDIDIVNAQTTENTRLAVTEEEEITINDLKERLSGYENALSELNNTVDTKTKILLEKNHDELVDLVKPIIGKKTKEQLVDTILNTEYSDIDIDTEQDSANLKKHRENKKEELGKMSNRKLVAYVISNKTSQKLVELLLYDEFFNSIKNVKLKILKLGLKIKNLGLGKYIPRQPNVKRLKYTELQYRDYIIINIRRLELKNKSYEELALIASSIGAVKSKKSLKLINNILSVEFSGYNISDKIPTVTSNEMKSVLITLDEDQIHSIASSKGIRHPEKSGKYYNIDAIIRKEFPAKKDAPTKQLVVGDKVRNWDYHKRQTELEAMNTNDLKTIALMINLDLGKSIKNEQLIKGILEHEKYIAKLIPKEDLEKEIIIKKITEITGVPESRYKKLSLEKLEQKIKVLRDESKEYLVEMEKERLYNKLSQIVNIKEPKYLKAQSWSLKKLRKKLEQAAGSDWEDYKPLIEDYSFVKCMKKFNTFEWIKGKVTGVWLRDNDEEENEYIFKNISIEEDGLIWYQANKKFFALQCNSYKKDRVQNGDILTSYTQTGKKVKFMVGYTITGYQYEDGKHKTRTHMVETKEGKKVQRTFIIQDEALFNKEKEFTRSVNQSDMSRVKDLLNSSVTESTADGVMKSISTSLMEIAPMKSDYGIITLNSRGIKTVNYNTPYMQILMATLRDTSEQTNNELFTKAASLLVFLNIPESKTFRNNIENEYYLPDILATLSSAEKFPEAFQDPNASGKFLDELTANINNKIFKMVRGFADYHIQDPTNIKRTDYSFTDFSRSIKTSKRLNACSNKDRVKGVSEEEIVYYNENGTIYCFTVNELYNQLLIEGNLNNPETGKPFDIAFVKRFDELYNKKLSEDGLLTGYFQKKYGFDMEELIKNKEKKDTIKSYQNIIGKNLWDIIGKDLAELEDQLSNENPNDGDEIDENREEEKRDVDVKKGVREKREIEEKDACVYCKNHLSDDSIKSIILHGDQSRIVKFCSFKCFENKNDWDKFKIKKVKKAVDKKEDEEKAVDSFSFNKGKKKKASTKKKKTWTELTDYQKKHRKKLFNKLINEESKAYYNFPLMSKTKLRELAATKNINIPMRLNRDDTAFLLYKKLYPRSTMTKL